MLTLPDSQAGSFLKVTVNTLHIGISANHELPISTVPGTDSACVWFELGSQPAPNNLVRIIWSQLIEPYLHCHRTNLIYNNRQGQIQTQSRHLCLDRQLRPTTTEPSTKTTPQEYHTLDTRAWLRDRRLPPLQRMSRSNPPRQGYQSTAAASVCQARALFYVCGLTRAPYRTRPTDVLPGPGRHQHLDTTLQDDIAEHIRQ